MEQDFQFLLGLMIDESDLSDIQKRIAKEKINLNANISIEDFSKSKLEIQKQIASLGTYIKTTLGDSVSDKQANQWAKQYYDSMINGARQAAKEQDNLAKIQISKNNAIKKSIEEINRIEQLGTNKSKVASLTNDLKNYTNESKLASDQIRNLQNAHNTLLTSQSNLLKGTGNETDLINSNKLLQEEYTKTANVLKQLSIEGKKLSQSDLFNRTRSNSLNKIDTFLKENSALSKTTKNQFLELRAAIESASDVKSLKNLNSELTNLQRNAKAAGETGRNFGDEMQNNFRKFSQWVGASAIFFGVQRAIKGVVNNVKELDKAMTSLYKVTDETDAKYNSFLQGAFTNSKRLGQSVSDLVEQTANWAKLGYSIDESANLAQISSIYSNVGEVDNATAVGDMVTAMKAFNIESSKSISIVDSFNKLGNEFATSSAGIGEGLRNSASALALAGNDINQSMAMITGGAEIIQDAGEMGNAIKILSMRLRGMKGELEAIGEEYDNVESVSKIQTQILNRTKGTVNIFDDVGNFKSTYEIIQGIAKIWNEISQTDQADKTCLYVQKCA